MKKLIPALALLLVSAVLLATSSFAWFSMNTTVTVTGMEVSTKVGSNLQIATTNTEALYTNGLNQARSAVLEPVSTVDGETFFWHDTTNNVLGSGNSTDQVYTEYDEDTALANAGAGKTNYDDDFVAAYGFIPTITTSNVAYGYVDYSFFLKATNAKNVAQKLSLTRCNLTYKGGAIGTEKAWRVAVFADATTAGTDAAADSSIAEAANLITILAPASATYFESGKAADSASTRDDVTNLSTAATIDGTVAAGTTVYYQIVVRLWLEGEDTTCNNNTFASLTDDYRLDLQFSISDATGVTVIGSTGSAVATAENLVGTVTLSNTTSGNIANGEPAASFQWYDASDDSAASAGTGATTYQYTAAAAGDFYCVVTTARGSEYRTNTVHLAPAP
ncbi:MAG: hypothetical protein J5958_07255 [Clostridia bacterium]|nr:hypothetical protein [Clostridia bacterium]